MKRGLIINSFYYIGTFVATFVMKDKIFLLSDGRIVDSRAGTITSESFSKVHRLTNKVGMLTAGRYLPNLTTEISNICENMKTVYVDEVVKIAKTVLEKTSEQLYLRINNQELVKDIRIFVFIVGFDENSNPRLFYLDNMSKPPFKIQERMLFQSGYDIEIGAMSTGSGEFEDPSSILVKHFKREYELKGRYVDLVTIIHSAFSYTKEEMSKRNHQIGGEVFISCIDFQGFRKIL